MLTSLKYFDGVWNYWVEEEDEDEEEEEEEEEEDYFIWWKVCSSIYGNYFIKR